MRLDDDSFRALARSSPWRWTTVHLRHREGREASVSKDEVEAWLTRPDGVRVEGPDGRPISPSVAGQRTDGRPTRPGRIPDATYRPDGLVAERPELSDDDGLFWNNYSWVAMLDPVELSHHVAVIDCREDEIADRPVWRARLVAEDGYEPRCGGNCCELLYSEAGLLADFRDLSEVPERWRGRTYPDAHDVALDVETGIVVRLHPVGGDDTAPWLENDIIAAG